MRRNLILPGKQYVTRRGPTCIVLKEEYPGVWKVRYTVDFTSARVQVVRGRTDFVASSDIARLADDPLPNLRRVLDALCRSLGINYMHVQPTATLGSLTTRVWGTVGDACEDLEVPVPNFRRLPDLRHVPDSLHDWTVELLAQYIAVSPRKEG